MSGETVSDVDLCYEIEMGEIDSYASSTIPLRALIEEAAEGEDEDRRKQLANELRQLADLIGT